MTGGGSASAVSLHPRHSLPGRFDLSRRRTGDLFAPGSSCVAPPRHPRDVPHHPAEPRTQADPRERRPAERGEPCLLHGVLRRVLVVEPATGEPPNERRLGEQIVFRCGVGHHPQVAADG